MKKFTVGNKELLNAVEKASVGAKETYIITITKRANSEGKKFASIAASDGEIKSLASFLATCDDPEGFKVIVGKEFYNIVRTLSQLSKDIEMEIIDNAAILKCGTSVVPVSIKEDGMDIAVINPNNEPEALSVSVNTEELISAVRKGGYAYPVSTSTNTGLTNAVCLIPIIDGENNYLRFVTADGYNAAGADAKLDKVSANFADSVKAKKTITLNATALQNIVSKFENESTDIYLFSKQVLIKNGNDFYIIRPFEKQFPIAITGMLYQDAREYEIQLSARELKTVLDITMLDGSEGNDKKYAILTLTKDGQVTVSSVSGRSSTKLNMNTHLGEVKICFKAQFMKTAIDKTFSEKISISGCGSISPIYIKGDDTRAISLILPSKLRQNKDEEEARDTDEQSENENAVE